MVIKAQITGQVVAIDTYVFLKANTARSTQKDGALFALSSFTITDGHSDFIVDAFEYAFIDFAALAAYDFEPGDELAITGTITPMDIIQLHHLQATRRQIAGDVKKLVNTANEYERRRLKRYRKHDFGLLTAALSRGQLSPADWLEEQEAFNTDRPGGRPKFVEMQTRLKGALARLDERLQDATDHVVVFTRVDTLALAQDEAIETPLTATNDLQRFLRPIYTGAPARKRYPREWWHYRDRLQAAKTPSQ